MTDIKPWENKIQIDEQSVKDILHLNVPDIEVDTISLLGEGWDNTTWLVNNQWCFRLPKHKESAVLLKNEMRVLSNLLDFGLSVPKPRWVCNEPRQYPFPFYGHLLLKGATADRCRLSYSERTALSEPIACFLKKLHSIPTSQMINLGVQYDQINRLDVSDRYPKTKERLAYLDKHRIVEGSDIYLNYFERHLSLKVPDDTVLGHGDFYARHIMLNDDKQLSGIIDWGDSELMHPSIDLAIVYQFLPKVAHKTFWSVYGSVSEITMTLAKLRAIYSSVTLCWYAHQVSDEDLMQEGKSGLALLREVLDA